MNEDVGLWVAKEHKKHPGHGSLSQNKPCEPLMTKSTFRGSIGFELFAYRASQNLEEYFHGRPRRILLIGILF